MDFIVLHHALLHFKQPSSIFTHLPFLAIPRPPGSSNLRKVEKYIVNHVNPTYKIEIDSFMEQGINFRNIVCSQHPEKRNRIVLAAHYDSLAIPGFQGAIDSAVSCAMLIEYSYQLPKDKGIDLIFFDGEEEIKGNMLYGSRHLANKMDTSAIQLFILLDLLGSKDCKLDTFHGELSQIEKTLFGENQLFVLSGPPQQIIDDHIPFVEKGVSVLHLIPFPFPKVWHTLEDRIENLDRMNVNKIFKVIKVFVEKL